MINQILWDLNPVSNHHKFIHGSELLGSQVIFHPRNIFLILDYIFSTKLDRLLHIRDIKLSALVLSLRHTFL